MDKIIRKADILIEALPYLRRFRGAIIVAKYGGSALADTKAMRGILRDIVFLQTAGMRPVLVHGGGPLISLRLAEGGRPSSFINGMRVTSPVAMRTIKSALEEINRSIVAQIRGLGGRAYGMASRHRILSVSPHPESDKLGQVGCVRAVRTSAIRSILSRQAIPVVAPLGVRDGRVYNVNADNVASYVAASLSAEKLVLLTNVRGILRVSGRRHSLIPTLSVGEAERLIERGIVRGGMIPKVLACIEALKMGLNKAHIIAASLPHAMLLEIFTTRGIGTEIVRNRRA